MLSKLTLKFPNNRKLPSPIFVQHLFIDAEFVNLHLSNEPASFKLPISTCLSKLYISNQFCSVSHFNCMMRKISIAVMFILAILVSANAQQVVYSQNFEDTASLFQDYVLSNLDKGVPAETGMDTLQTVAWFVDLAGSGNNHAAIATSNYNPSVAADDWFITPAMRLGEKSILTFKSLSFTQGKTDTYEVYVSNTEQSVSGCLFNPMAGQFTSSNSAAFEEHEVDLAAAGFASQVVYIGFRLTTASGGDKIAIDDIAVTETVTQFHNLTFIVNMSEYITDSSFFPRTDTVDVAGTFNNFEGTKHILSIVPGTDSAIYAITIPGFITGDRLEFKFRINSTWNDSIVEFPYGQPNRVWVIEEGKYTYTCFYNDQGAPFGIPENTLMDQVNIFPNPARSIVSVEMPANILRVLMISLTGNKVLDSETTSGNTLTFDVSSIAKGTYVLLFYTKEGYAGSKKLIKN
jgi:hypothetical protein